MGLEDAPHFAVGNPGSCLKGSCDLCGMVGIVIHNGDAAYGAFVFKASAGAAKGGLGAVEHEPGVSHLVKRYT